LTARRQPRAEGLAVEQFTNADGVNNEMRDLLNRGAQRGDMYWWADPHGGFWLSISRAGLNRLWFGEPMRFAGDPDDDDAVIEEKVWLVRQTIQSMVNHALKERRHVFW